MQRRSPSPQRGSPSPQRGSPSPIRRSPSPGRRTPGPSPPRAKLSLNECWRLLFNELEKNCSLMVQFYKKHNLPLKLKEHKFISLLVPTDTAVQTLAQSLGISVQQMLREKSFFDIVFNHIILSKFNPFNLERSFHETSSGLSISYKHKNRTSPIKLDIDYDGEFEVNGNEYLSSRRTEFLSHYETPIDVPNVFIIYKVITTPEQLEKLKKSFLFLETPKETGKNFNLLDRGAISNILIHLTPKDVLKTCNVDKRFTHLCDNEELFKVLMKAHFPEYEIQNNSAAQTYKSIVNGTYLYYLVSSYDEHDIILEKLSNEQALRDYFMKFIVERLGYLRESFAVEYLTKFLNEETNNILKNFQNIRQQNNDYYFLQEATEKYSKALLTELKKSEIYKLKLRTLVNLMEELSSEDDVYSFKVSKGYPLGDE